MATAGAAQVARQEDEECKAYQATTRAFDLTRKPPAKETAFWLEIATYITYTTRCSARKLGNYNENSAHNATATMLRRP